MRFSVFLGSYNQTQRKAVRRKGAKGVKRLVLLLRQLGQSPLALLAVGEEWACRPGFACGNRSILAEGNDGREAE